MRLGQILCGLALLEAFGQDRGQPGLDGGFGVDQPLKVLAGQLEEPAGFSAPDHVYVLIASS